MPEPQPETQPSPYLSSEYVANLRDLIKIAERLDEMAFAGALGVYLAEGREALAASEIGACLFADSCRSKIERQRMLLATGKIIAGAISKAKAEEADQPD